METSGLVLSYEGRKIENIDPKSLDWDRKMHRAERVLEGEEFLSLLVRMCMNVRNYIEKT